MVSVQLSRALLFWETGSYLCKTTIFPMLPTRWWEGPEKKDHYKLLLFKD